MAFDGSSGSSSSGSAELLTVRLTQLFAAEETRDGLSVRTAVEDCGAAQMNDAALIATAAAHDPSPKRRKVRSDRQHTRAQPSEVSASLDNDDGSESPASLPSSSPQKRRLSKARASDSPGCEFAAVAHRQFKPLICYRSTRLGDLLSLLQSLLNARDCNKLALVLNHSTEEAKEVDLTDPSYTLDRAGFLNDCELFVIDKCDSLWSERGRSIPEGVSAVDLASMERDRRADPKHCVQFCVEIRTDGMDAPQTHTLYMDGRDNLADLCQIIDDYIEEESVGLFYGLLRQRSGGFFVSDFDSPLSSLFPAKKTVRTQGLMFDATAAHRKRVESAWHSDSEVERVVESNVQRYCHVRYVFKNGSNSVITDEMDASLHGFADMSEVSGCFELLINKEGLPLADLRALMVRECGLREDFAFPIEKFDLRFCSAEFRLKASSAADFSSFCDVITDADATLAMSKECTAADGRPLTVEDWLLRQPRKRDQFHMRKKHGGAAKQSRQMYETRRTLPLVLHKVEIAGRTEVADESTTAIQALLPPDTPVAALASDDKSDFGVDTVTHIIDDLTLAVAAMQQTYHDRGREKLYQIFSEFRVPDYMAAMLPDGQTITPFPDSANTVSLEEEVAGATLLEPGRVD